MTKILGEMAIQLFFLVAGIVLIGLGVNFYLAFGLAALIIYSNTVK